MKLKLHPIVAIFIIGDFVLVSGWALIAPIFALFIVRNIEGGTATIVGIAAAIYWISKSLFQVPIGLYLDKRKGERDDFYVLVLSFIVIGLVSFAFLWVKTPIQLYGLQLIHAFGFAMMTPSWSAIFTRHMDKGKEAFEWSLSSTSIGLGAGLSGLVGGVVADKFGFEPIFIVVGIVSLLSTVFPLWAYFKYGPSERNHAMVFTRKDKDLHSHHK